MKWLWFLLITGCAHVPILLGSNWERICYDAPYRAITPQVKSWLRQEGVVEQHGWKITSEWLNANCETMPSAHRR